MALIIPRNYSTGVALTKAQLDAAFDAVETLINTTKLSSTELQTSAVATANIADSAVTAAKIAAAVAGDGLAGGAGTALSVSVDSSTIEISADSLRVKDSGIGTAKIADAAVTPAKKAALGQQISSSSGAYTTTSTSFTDVTNLTFSITVTGRPVMVALIPDGDTVNVSCIGVTNSGSTAAGGQVKIRRGSTTLGLYLLRNLGSNTTRALQLPPSSFFLVDTGASAGTQSYAVSVLAASGTDTVNVSYVKLIAYEL